MLGHFFEDLTRKRLKNLKKECDAQQRLQKEFDEQQPPKKLKSSYKKINYLVITDGKPCESSRSLPREAH